MIIPLHLSKSSLSRETCQRSSRPEVPLGIKKEVIFSSILTVICLSLSLVKRVVRNEDILVAMTIIIAITSND